MTHLAKMHKSKTQERADRLARTGQESGDNQPAALNFHKTGF